MVTALTSRAAHLSARPVGRPVPPTPRSNLALENTHRSGGPARHPLASVAVFGDYLAEGAIAVNARGVVTYVNRIAVGLLGIRAESLLGRDVLSLAGPAHSDTASQFARALAEVLEHGLEQLLTVNDTDAAPAFNVDYCRLLPIADGGALILLGETMSPSVSEQLSRARALAEILQSLNQSLEVERVLQLLAKHSAELLAGGAAHVLLLEDDNLRPTASFGTSGGAVGGLRESDQALAAEAVRARRAVRADDLDATTHERAAATVMEPQQRGRIGAV